MNPTVRVSELDRIIRDGKAEWAVALPIIYALGVLCLIDIMMGFLAAYHDKAISSERMREGLIKKAALFLTLAALAVVDPFVSFPLTYTFALGFALSQITSLIENAGRLGVEIPKEAFDRLAKLRGEKAPIKKKKPPGAS